jgi:Family of unknown function (DUF6338)
MELSNFLIRFIFLVIPGIISSKLYRRLKGKPPRKDWEDFLEIFVFSIINYVASSFCLALLLLSSSSVWSINFYAFKAFYEERLAITNDVIWEIIGASIIGILSAMLFSLIEKFRVIGRIGFRMGLSKRLGDTDVWEIVLSSPNKGYITIRDHKTDLAYYGWVEHFSESYLERELLMRNVSVFNNEGQLLYPNPVDGMYFSREKYDITIEIPEILPKNIKDKKRDENNG